MTVLHRRGGLRTWQLGALLGLLAFVPRALTAMHGFPHPDEVRWLQRSGHYARAMLTLDLANATSSSSSVRGHPTMPGITTAFVGGVARVLWGGARDLGALSFPHEGFRSSHSGLVVAQLLMALATSGLLVLLWWVLSVWATRVVATAAVVILATEPLLIADGTKLKTDSFLMLFGAIGAFALAAALRVPTDAAPHVRRRRQRLLAVVAGIAIAGAALSKTTALAFVPFFAGIVLFAAARAWRTQEHRREVVVVTALAVGAAFATVVVLWPALWADPSGQLDLLRGTETLARAGHAQYFLGEYTPDPGALFYFVVEPLRMTPWLVLGGIVGAVAGLRARATRGFAIVALAYAAVPFLVIVLAEKKFVRYAFPLWPVLAVLFGLLVQRVATWARDGGARRWRSFEVASVGAVAGVAVYALLIVPYVDAYANPLLGGGPVADDAMLIGPDSGSEVGTLIRDREGAACDDRRILARKSSLLWFPCGDLTRSVDELRPGDYIVLFATDTKRMAQPEVDALRLRGPRVATLRTRGIDLAEVIQVR